MQDLDFCASSGVAKRYRTTWQIQSIITPPQTVFLVSLSPRTYDCYWISGPCSMSCQSLLRTYQAHLAHLPSDSSPPAPSNRPTNGKGVSVRGLCLSEPQCSTSCRQQLLASEARSTLKHGERGVLSGKRDLKAEARRLGSTIIASGGSRGPCQLWYI